MSVKPISIERKIKNAFIRMLIVLIISLLANMISSYTLTIRYNQLITNVEYANDLKDLVVSDIYNVTFSIVSGMTAFDEGDQYDKVDAVYIGLEYLVANTTLETESTQLEVARRTTDTLKSYVDQLGEALNSGAKVDVTLEIQDEIKNVSILVGELISEFIYYEVRNAARLNEVMIRTQNFILVMDLIVILLFTVYLFRSVKRLTSSISGPISELESMAGKIASGDFEARVKTVGVLELRSLTKSLNIMASRIKDLIDENDREHDNLKKAELSLLQAQIKPHFLYNTYDTIIWLAEKNSVEDIVKVVEALTVFYRVALSKGNDWISLQNEISHIESYLVIQHFRYGDILEYEIDIDEEVLHVKVLKLLLQPVVENALYHGIKYLRSKGQITIRGYIEDKHMILSVTDTGAGMDHETLTKLRKYIYDDTIVIEKPDKIDKKSGFGLRNVHSRIQLYYGKDYGISIHSNKGIGTTVTLKLGLTTTHHKLGDNHV